MTSQKMSQQSLGVAVSRDFGVTGKERRSLDVWPEDDGWCSACRAEGTRVVHLGVRHKVDVGICVACVGRLYAAALQPTEETEEDEEDDR